VERPLIRTELSETIQPGQLDAFADADAGGARQQEGIGGQVVGAVPAVTVDRLVEAAVWADSGAVAGSPGGESGPAGGGRWRRGRPVSAGGSANSRCALGSTSAVVVRTASGTSRAGGEQARYLEAYRVGVGEELIRELDLINLDIMRQSLGPSPVAVG